MSQGFRDSGVSGTLIILVYMPNTCVCRMNRCGMAAERGIAAVAAASTKTC